MQFAPALRPCFAHFGAPCYINELAIGIVCLRRLCTVSTLLLPHNEFRYRSQPIAASRRMAKVGTTFHDNSASYFGGISHVRRAVIIPSRRGDFQRVLGHQMMSNHPRLPPL